MPCVNPTLIHAILRYPISEEIAKRLGLYRAVKYRVRRRSMIPASGQDCVQIILVFKFSFDVHLKHAKLTSHCPIKTKLRGIKEIYFNNNNIFHYK